MERAIHGCLGGRSECHRAWATALAVAWLEQHAADAEGEWKFLRRKARRWLDAVPAAPSVGLSWPEAARQFLAT
jgi:hypothetical protein